MLSKVLSGITIGLDGALIEVEVDVANRGFPTLIIVGLPNKAVDEAKERVRTAIVNTRLEVPDSRITVNLAPADIPKMGCLFDLPIAIGILAASGIIEKNSLKNSLLIGELSLEGKLRQVPGVISIVIMAKKNHIKNIYLPRDNALEASMVDGIDIYPIDTLSDLILHLNGDKILKLQPNVDIESLYQEEKYDFDFADIKGQEQAKRVMEIAAAGFHNVHLKGPPGTGKTMLSRAFPSILPKMLREEILEVTKIYSITGLLNNSYFVIKRPFRAPHHTTSRIGLIGGSANPQPGEVSLAHRGVLFLDEFPEFPRSVLEALRQPLEDGFVNISRAAGSLTFPSRFLFLAASNPCPCGYLGHPKKQCSCMPGSIIRYKKRLSGPLLDRIDLHIDVPPVDENKLMLDNISESSMMVRKRVEAARKIQEKRFANIRTKTNGEMSSADIKNFCSLASESIMLLKQAISQLSLSARSYFKIIKISQTIADLNNSPTIKSHHITEALQYRAKDEL